MRIALAAGAAALGIVPGLPAFSQEVSAAPISTSTVAEVIWDRGEGGADEVWTRINAITTARLAGGLSLEGHVVVDRVAEPAGDSVLRGEGAWVDALDLRYSGDAFSLYAGKFDPAFGSAFNWAPGPHGADVSLDYQQVERIGLGGDVNFGRIFGGDDHVLSFAAFTADRTELSRSLFTDRGRLRLEDGGVGNTQGLKSMTLSLDGQSEAGWTYSLGVRRLAAGEGDETAETAAVVGATYAWRVGEFDATAFGEVVGVDGADGVRGGKRSYYTVGGSLQRGAWTGSSTLSGRHDGDVIGGGDYDQLELTIGRTLAEGLSLEGGVEFRRTDGDTVPGGSIRLVWTFG